MFFLGSSIEGGRRLLSWEAPAARGCSMEGGRRLLLGELPLRGAARWREKEALSRGALLDGGGKEAAFLGSSRCAELLG